jgi:hypothetical protein
LCTSFRVFYDSLAYRDKVVGVFVRFFVRFNWGVVLVCSRNHSHETVHSRCAWVSTNMDQRPVFVVETLFSIVLGSTMDVRKLWTGNTEWNQDRADESWEAEGRVNESERFFDTVVGMILCTLQLVEGFGLS